MNTKQLREKFLSLAIGGKLVPQDANDEPAIELLKRINPKIQPIIEDVPFDVPESWAWCRLDSLCKIKGGKRIPKGMTLTEDKTSHVYLRVADMKNNTIQLTDLKYIDDEVYDLIKNYTISSTDLYLTIAGTIGKVGIIPNEVDGMNLTENAAKLTNILCNKLYLMYALQSETLQQHFNSKFHQVAQPKLSIETASKTLVPLPPLAEQLRIVEKLEYIFALIDTIEQAQDKMCETIKAIRQKLLSLAIEGKLVPQDANDEPAIELLKRINPKIQPITEVVPFDVPESWVWCKMYDVITLLSGRDLEKDKYYSINNGLPYIIGATNFENGQLLVNRWTDKPATISHKGDLLITCKGTIGKMAFNNIGDIHIARQVMAIHSYYINLMYIQAFLKYNISSLETQAKSMIPGISRDTILNTFIPIPPIAEQQRIVEKLENLFSTLDTIDSNLN